MNCQAVSDYSLYQHDEEDYPHEMKMGLSDLYYSLEFLAESESDLFAKMATQYLDFPFQYFLLR